MDGLCPVEDGYSGANLMYKMAKNDADSVVLKRERDFHNYNARGKDSTRAEIKITSRA